MLGQKQAFDCDKTYALKFIAVVKRWGWKISWYMSNVLFKTLVIFVGWLSFDSVISLKRLVICLFVLQNVLVEEFHGIRNKMYVLFRGILIEISDFFFWFCFAAKSLEVLLGSSLQFCCLFLVRGFLFFVAQLGEGDEDQVLVFSTTETKFADFSCVGLKSSLIGNVSKIKCSIKFPERMNCVIPYNEELFAVFYVF